MHLAIPTLLSTTRIQNLATSPEVFLVNVLPEMAAATLNAGLFVEGILCEIQGCRLPCSLGTLFGLLIYDSQ